MLKIKKDKNSSKDRVILFFIGFVLLAIFYFGGNFAVLKSDINKWPKAKARVTTIKQKEICETPETSSACYAVFIVNYVYSVNGKQYSGNIRQEFSTTYSVGKEFDVYYKANDHSMSFSKDNLPERINLYLPLIFGLSIIIPGIILWLYKRIR